ncbi:MAG: hypothetical protein O2955_04305 [Planctomycetota bacterium]|nr:hypothetical protein [Planctomycetota bacterium]MDA1211712.1 hypothetical protein [Planctomycetota bacterium]
MKKQTDPPSSNSTEASAKPVDPAEGGADLSAASNDTASDLPTLEGDTESHGTQGQSTGKAAVESEQPSPQNSDDQTDANPSDQETVHSTSPFGGGKNFSSDGTKRKNAVVKRSAGGMPVEKNKRTVISPLALQPTIDRTDASRAMTSIEHKKASKSRFRNVNLRFLLGLMVVFVVCVGTTMGLHTLQVKRLAVSLLDQKRRAERTGDDKLAARYLSQYLGYNTNDIERYRTARRTGGTPAKDGRKPSREISRSSVYGKSHPDGSRTNVDSSVACRSSDAVRPLQRRLSAFGNIAFPIRR